MSETPAENRVTRKQWVYCVLVSVGIFALNHYYALQYQRFYPIVVWGAPMFALVGLAGIIYPNLMSIPKTTIFLWLIGLAIGVAAHYFLYGF
jgi:hypothetical protein